jgi:hypothetical protein
MFNNKKDPLVDAVKKIMEQNEKEREAVRRVNEAFGVHSKKALPHELHAKYDAMLEEANRMDFAPSLKGKISSAPKQAVPDSIPGESSGEAAERKNIEAPVPRHPDNAETTRKIQMDMNRGLREAKKCMYEEDDDKELSPKQKKLAAKAGDKDEIEAVDLAKLRKDKTLEEAKATEAQKEKVAKVMHKWKKGKEHIGKSDKTVPVTKKGQKQAVAIALSQAGLSKKKKMDESFDALNEEIRNNLLEKLNSVYETYGEQAAQYAYDTLSEEERRILSERQGTSWLRRNTPTTYNYGATSTNYGAFGEPKTTPTTSPAPFSSTSKRLTAMNTPGSIVGGKPVLGGARATNPDTTMAADEKSGDTGGPESGIDFAPAAKPAAARIPAPAARTPATAPKPAATTTSTDTGSPSGSFSQQPSWARNAFSGEGGPSTSEPSTTRSVRQAPERKSSSSFSRATRGDFSGITGGGGA